MGKSVVSVGVMVNPFSGDGNPAKLVLSDPDRRKEVDELLNSCRRHVTTLLRQKRHVVEGLRDALLEREELIGDEIEEIMAELGEREPLAPVAVGDGHGDAPSQGGSGEGPEGNGPVSGNGPPGGPT
jgi:hypothetical protein